MTHQGQNDKPVSINDFRLIHLSKINLQRYDNLRNLSALTREPIRSWEWPITADCPLMSRLYSTNSVAMDSLEFYCNSMLDRLLRRYGNADLAYVCSPFPTSQRRAFERVWERLCAELFPCVWSIAQVNPSHMISSSGSPANPPYSWTQQYGRPSHRLKWEVVLR